jgi:hypothetical protein
MGISRVFRMVSGLVLGLATCIGMSGQARELDAKIERILTAAAK